MSIDFDAYPLPYIDAQTLLSMLKGYRNPRDAIFRMVKSGKLVRLKNGFYLIAKRIKGAFRVSHEQVANLLYGPSYVSLEWALSYYGLIPEKVTMVTSVTTGRKKEFQTPIGVFAYTHLSIPQYAVGVDRPPLRDMLGGFLIATPEKALIDYIFLRWGKFEELKDFLESMRIEVEDLKKLDLSRLELIGRSYKDPNIDRFIEAVRML